MGIRIKLTITFAVVLCAASIYAANHRETPLVLAVQRVKGSVVNIHSEKTAQRKDTVFSSSGDRKVNGMGSGIIIDERGYIATNYHVVHEVDLLRVTLANGGTYHANVISYDRRKDLAIIKIDATEPLPVMPLGRSKTVMLAESVFAVGNAFGYEHTVTSGIVSALSRDVDVNEEQSYERLIQTDASINPGNSGGPLLNLDGEVVGINVAIRAGAQRIGFAIPIDDARATIARLMSIERLNGTTHGLIGRDMKDANTSTFVVNNVRQGSPAQVAGLLPGDKVQQVGRINIADAADFERALLGRRAGQPVDVTVMRDGEEQVMKMVLNRLNGAAVRSVSKTRQIPQPAVNPTNSEAWRVLGLKVASISPEEVRSLGTQYRGGMKITSVRNAGPAMNSSIQPGDILLGINGWETISLDNLAFVINKAAEEKKPSLDFFVIRSGRLLQGRIQVASR